MLSFDTDVNELVYLARCGSQTAYCHLYRGLKPAFVHLIKVSAGPLSNADFEDMLSVSMEMLHKVLCAWRAQGGLSFVDYTDLIFARKIRGIVKSRYTAKERAWNHIVSLSEPYGYSGTLADVIESSDRMCDPRFAMELESLRESLQKARDALPEDYLIAEEYWEKGCSYAESARAMSVSFKSYDGKLRRAKEMMKRCLVQDDWNDKGLV